MSGNDVTAKVLVLGAGGMLGHTLCRTLASKYQVFGALRRPINATILPAERQIEDFDALSDQCLLAAISTTKPDVVINCVGLIKRPPEVDDSALAISLNALLPHRIKKIADSAGARLIHVSTDCVFDGKRGSYSESDRPDATDLYGRTKLLGEVDGESLTIRTSMIGPQLTVHKSLFDWFVKNKAQTVPGYARAYFSGLTTVELSHTIAQVIASFPELKGLYHISGERIDKCSLLQMIKREFGVEIEIKEDRDFIIDRSLDDTRFRSVTGIPRKSWPAMLHEMRVDFVSQECREGSASR